jgi:tetratricopeptide (TPR) repeat protein
MPRAAARVRAVAYRVVPRLPALLLLVTALGAAGCGARPAPRPPPLAAEAYARYLEGRLALYRGDYDRAVAQLRAASAAAPDEVMITVALIDAIYRTGAREAARDEVRAAQARWPHAPEVWLVAGKVWRGLRDHERARLAFERAIQLDRTSERGWLGLAAAWAALGQPERAEATYRRLLRALPESVEGRFLLAERLAGRRADGEAEPHLRKVLELHADHIDARLLLARALRRGGRLAEAVVETRQAFDRTGGDLEVAEELFWLLCEADDRQGALDLLGVLDDPAASVATRVGIAHLYRQLGALDEAIRVADGALAAVPDSPAARLIAAQARADRGRAADRAEAVALLLAIPLDERTAAPARALAVEVLIALGELDGARTVIEEARASRADAVDLLAAHARLLHSLGQTGAGRRLLEEAVGRRRGSISLRYALASYEHDVGQPGRAAAHAARIVAARQDHVAALNLAGYALAKVGRDLDRAERMLARARELAPGDPAVLDSWGWLLYRRGRLAEAEEVLARAARLAPHLPEIQQHLAEVRARLRRAGPDRAVLESSR